MASLSVIFYEINSHSDRRCSDGNLLINCIAIKNSFESFSSSLSIDTRLSFLMEI